MIKNFAHAEVGETKELVAQCVKIATAKSSLKFCFENSFVGLKFVPLYYLLLSF